MVTLSWNAVFALRSRVSMSAIGSVIVMLLLLSRRGSPRGLRRSQVLPRGFGDARQFAGVRHLAEADPAQAELAVDGLRAAAALAAGVAAHLELRLGRRLVAKRSLRHQMFSLNGKPRARSSARPSSSVAADVTTVMSMPRGR